MQKIFILSTIQNVTKLRILLNLGGLFLLFGFVYLLTLFAEPIRNIVNSPKMLVAGATDIATERDMKGKFAEQLATDAKEQMTKTKDSLLNIKLGEIITFVGRGQKIVEDIRHASKEIQSIIK